MEEQSVDDEDGVVDHNLAFVQSVKMFDLQFDASSAHKYGYAQQSLCFRHGFEVCGSQLMPGKIQWTSFKVFVSRRKIAVPCFIRPSWRS